MSVYLHVCMWTMCLPGVCRVHKRVLDPLKLELQMVVGCLVVARKKTWALFKSKQTSLTPEQEHKFRWTLLQMVSLKKENGCYEVYYLTKLVGCLLTSLSRYELTQMAWNKTKWLSFKRTLILFQGVILSLSIFFF